MNAKQGSRSGISDAFWAQVEPWIPVPPARAKHKRYQRAPGGGRKPLEARVIFEAIVHVLRSRCAWKDLPRRRYGSASAIHKHFKYWAQCGFFFTLWEQGLAASPELEGIAWTCVSGVAGGPHTRWQPAGLHRRRLAFTDRNFPAPHRRTVTPRGRAAKRRSG